MPAACQVIAHRGGSHEVPENTWAAVEHVAALGLTWMETDLRCTKDGVVILAHDGDYSRIVGDARPISSLTWDEVRQLDAGDGREPVRLDAALRTYPDLCFNMDLKDEGVVRRAVDVVVDADAIERTRFASFSSGRLRRARAYFPHIRTSLGMAEVGRLVGAGVLRLLGHIRPVDEMRRHGEYTRHTGAMGALEQAGVRLQHAAGMLSSRPLVTRKPDAVQVPVSQWGIPVVTAAFVKAAHARGMEVHVWTIDDPQQMRQLAALGVDGIVTDLPETALKTLA